MLFNSTSYLLFMPIVAVLFYALRPNGRRWLLLTASYLFYALSALTIGEQHPEWNQAGWLHQVLRIGLLHTTLIVGTTLFNYWIAKMIGAVPDSDEATQFPGSCPPSHTRHPEVSALPDASSRRAWLTVGVVTNLTLLALYKYAGFISSTANSLLQSDALPALKWILPLGISFYTFEVISYIVDVYLGMTRPIRSLRDMALYVSFFPHLIAGPIIRSEDLVPQLSADQPLDWTNIREGIARFIWGMVKKVYVADVMAKSGGGSLRQPVHRVGVCARARNLCLCRAGLRGFLGLLRYGDRLGADAWDQVAGEFRFALSLLQHSRILAAMAHQPFDVAARLSVHPARR